MTEINVYEWEDIRKYFPPEKVAKIRPKSLNCEIPENLPMKNYGKKYGMSERTFYDLVARGKEGITGEDLKDRPA